MQELKETLVKLCNESGLPLEAIYFVVKDLMRDVERTLDIYTKELEKKKEDEVNE